jgi:hypothetical protein
MLPFDWLTFLDRQLTNPMEILQVPAVSPVNLTQTFVLGIDTPGGRQVHQHLAQWLDSTVPTGQSTRLFRALELLGTRDRAAGMSGGGRVPGRVNINTLWDLGTLLDNPPTAAPGTPFLNPDPTLVVNQPTLGQTRLGSNDVFRAVCDASPSNRFNQNDVDQIYAKLIRSRTLNLTGTPGFTDRPFRGFAVPISGGALTGDPQFQTTYNVPDMTSPTAQAPPGTYNGQVQASDNGIGLEDTLFRSAPFATPPPNGPPTPVNSGPLGPLFGVNAGKHPYLQTELLRKVGATLTTRSNVFAVWVTVGMFEVTDETVNPVRLGKEVGSDTGTQKRTRMFSVVDRTNLAIDPTSFITPGTQVVNPANPNPTAGTTPPLKQAVKPFFLSYNPVQVRKDPNSLNLSAAPQQITGPGTVTVTLPPVDLESTFVGPAPPNANPGPWPAGTGYPNQSTIWPPDQANTGLVPLQGGTTSFPQAQGIPNPAQTQNPGSPSQVLSGYEGVPWETYVFNLVCDATTPYGRMVLAPVSAQIPRQPMPGIIGTPNAITVIPPTFPIAPTMSGTTTPPNPPVLGSFPRSMLLIDEGDRQEMVFVEKVETTVVSQNGVNVLVPTLTFTTNKVHAAGCSISNVPLGNPGPQGPIDWTADNFRSVVPLAAVIE